jgi:hypothetical protein
MPTVVRARWVFALLREVTCATCRFIKVGLVTNRINWRSGLLSVIFQ